MKPTWDDARNVCVWWTNISSNDGHLLQLWYRTHHHSHVWFIFILWFPRRFKIYIFSYIYRSNQHNQHTYNFTEYIKQTNKKLLQYIPVLEWTDNQNVISWLVAWHIFWDILWNCKCVDYADLTYKLVYFT
jgi:hypothetical protein